MFALEVSVAAAAAAAAAGPGIGRRQHKDARFTTRNKSTHCVESCPEILVPTRLLL